MSAFIRLHEAMYSNGTLGNITIHPISDNSKGLIWLLLYRLVPKFYEKEVYEILMLQADSITKEGRMASSLTLVDLSFEHNLKQSLVNFVPTQFLESHPQTCQLTLSVQQLFWFAGMIIHHPRITNRHYQLQPCVFFINYKRTGRIWMLEMQILLLDISGWII